MSDHHTKNIKQSREFLSPRGLVRALIQFLQNVNFNFQSSCLRKTFIITDSLKQPQFIQLFKVFHFFLDRKFGEKRKKWHPYRQFSDGKKTNENVSAIWERKFLKHSEYQDASGVKFPSATGNLFF